MSAALKETPALDKVSEEQMAELLDTTVKSLQHRRYRGQIPEGVWMKRGKAIYYSIRRYEEWLESQWICPPASKSTVAPSASGSLGTERGTVKISAFPRRKKGSRLPPSLEIR